MPPAESEEFAEFIEAIRSARRSVKLYVEQFGQDALVILANAIDEYSNAHSEVLLQKHDLEDFAMNERSVFIPLIMDKARTTQAYWDMTECVVQQVTDAIPIIVDEILESFGKEI